VAHSFDFLPLRERVQQYREMADATLLKAKTTDDPEISARYLYLATSWHTLAQQLENGCYDPEAIPDTENVVEHKRPSSN